MIILLILYNNIIYILYYYDVHRDETSQRYNLEIQYLGFNFLV